MSQEKLKKVQQWRIHVFIILVRTKDGKDYEPSSIRSSLDSFERHLKKKNYVATIRNNLLFKKTRKVLLSKQKELTKTGNEIIQTLWWLQLQIKKASSVHKILKGF